MSAIEKFCAAYWDAFRAGFLKVGGDPSYPLWKESNDPVKIETMRCVRHAMETLKKIKFESEQEKAVFIAVLEREFPDKPQSRNQKHVTASEVLLAPKLRRGS